jgi:hypothetical protein
MESVQNDVAIIPEERAIIFDGPSNDFELLNSPDLNSNLYPRGFPLEMRCGARTNIPQALLGMLGGVRSSLGPFQDLRCLLKRDHISGL